MCVYCTYLKQRGTGLNHCRDEVVCLVNRCQIERAGLLGPVAVRPENLRDVGVVHFVDLVIVGDNGQESKQLTQHLLIHCRQLAQALCRRHMCDVRTNKYPRRHKYKPYEQSF